MEPSTRPGQRGQKQGLDSGAQYKAWPKRPSTRPGQKGPVHGLAKGAQYKVLTMPWAIKTRWAQPSIQVSMLGLEQIKGTDEKQIPVSKENYAQQSF